MVRYTNYISGCILIFWIMHVTKISILIYRFNTKQTMNKIKQMLQLQQKLNDATSGTGWEEGFTNKGKPIDWRRCIYLETAELVDSYPWKHWKNIDAEPDYENVKIEVVDIWHFVMSEALRRNKIDHSGTMDDLALQMVNLPHYKDFADNTPLTLPGVFEQIEQIEELIAVLFASDDFLKWVDSFFAMSAKLNIKLDELYRLYVGKNVLNQFRQDHGYKEGKYIKQWNGMEDNVVMQAIMQEQENISPASLYEALEEKYPN